MVWRRFGPRMRKREWLPAPGPIETLHAILEQIAAHGRRLDVRTPTFDAAKQEFDAAVAGTADRELASRLESGCGVRPADLIVSVTENTREDWSFGLGRAQFLSGELRAAP